MFPGESPCDQDKSLAFVLVQSPQSIFWALLCEAQERCVICSMKALIFVKQWAARGDGVGPQQESDACAAWLSGSMGLHNFGHPCSLHLQFFFSWMHLTVLESFCALPALANLGKSFFHVLADGWHICFPESWFKKKKKPNEYSYSVTRDLFEVLHLS